MIKTKGHQTIEKTFESILERLQTGPLKSTILDEKGQKRKKPPFAGEGYYFWEDNLEAALWWGKVKYSNQRKGYRIFSIDITLRYDDNSFFDLIGNRQHLLLMQKMIEKTKKMAGVDVTNWKLPNYIDFFRSIEKVRSGFFAYKMIRFNDATANKDRQYPLLLSEKNNYTLINPFYIICVFNKEDLYLQTFRYLQ